MKLNEDFTNLYKRWKGGEVRKENKFNYNLIDLGLPSGTLWMDRNIGAKTVVDDGGYYAWGETEEKDEYTRDTYKFTKSVTKYNKEDGKTVLDTEDDVVYLKTKGKCHMPTKEQFEELVYETNNEWVKDYKGSGKNGRLFKSKTNDNSIFIPAAGSQYSNKISNIGITVNVWTSSIGHYEDAWKFTSESDECGGNGISNYNIYRCYGFSVRGCKD